jgi:phospholipid-translocating ATPase
MGMRTLIVAEKELTRHELNEFIAKLKAARRVIRNREVTIREIYSQIESHFTMVGATGVEDQLQEGVQQTLAALGAAGIRVWMLTGDKLETGENVRTNDIYLIQSCRFLY